MKGGGLGAGNDESGPCDACTITIAKQSKSQLWNVRQDVTDDWGEDDFDSHGLKGPPLML